MAARDAGMTLIPLGDRLLPLREDLNPPGDPLDGHPRTRMPTEGSGLLDTGAAGRPATRFKGREERDGRRLLWRCGAGRSQTSKACEG
jgi:hypothetical protein